MKKVMAGIVIMIAALSLWGTLVIAGNPPSAKASVAEGGYKGAFPVDPSRATYRNLLLHGCVPNPYYNDLKHWICPDAPPYTYVV
jgi:hypothetical protein